jgi:hypothetical protein
LAEWIPIDAVLDCASVPEGASRAEIGISREGRPLYGYRLGRGPTRISLIGGCHADEPVGPEMLGRLCAYLAAAPRHDPLVSAYSWSIVPHVNPDGDLRNSAWSASTVECLDHQGQPDVGYDIAEYAEHVVRELPGDDIEFGFPRSAEDREARPENRAVAGFLEGGGPFALHGSFHGMDLAAGPWFLIERSWVDRTGPMREALRQAVRSRGYRLFDIDRGGEKGFFRIDEGFTSRPDSKAMREHFLALGDEETADRFRPSSMEYVRTLGGDPLTIVSEMPLFVLKEGVERPHKGLKQIDRENGREGVLREAERLGLRPMPIRDQMRLQLAFLSEALRAIAQ